MRKRHGFTLVELLVVMALVMLILVILARAFGDGLGTLRRAKSIGDLQEKLRAATAILRRDLAADHFDGRRRVSDSEFDWSWPPFYGLNVVEPPALPYPPRRVPKGIKDQPGTGNRPREGLFSILPELATGGVDPQGRPNGQGTTYEGTDPDGVPSYRVTQRQLHFTVKLRGNNPKDFFSARLPAGSPLAGASTSYFNVPTDAKFQDAANTYNSQWAEVYYYLVDNGTTAGTTQLFTLRRSQFVLVADNSQINGKVPASSVNTDYSEFSCAADSKNPAVMYFNTPVDLAQGKGASLNTQTNPGAILLDDVISFEILPWSREAPQKWDHIGYNSIQPGISLTYYSPQWNVPCDGIRITLRVWDAKQLIARQITIFQDL